MSQTFVQSFTHLEDMPEPGRALTMLKRVASLVKPIMRKHGWVLPVLSEFFPENPGLLGLNLNGGEQILLRLRLPHARHMFREEGEVVRIMLHELTHNVHGPHDEHFYKFLAALEDEYDELQRSGYAGEGFYSPGHRLGAGISHNLPSYLGRERALAAAEHRRQMQLLSGGGRVHRLGGTGATDSHVSSWNQLSPRELAARAAERRKTDEMLCGWGTLGEAARAPKTSVRTNARQDEHAIIGTSRSNIGRRVNVSPPDAEQWTCSVCTLVNDSQTLQCAACHAKRPSSGWTCGVCTESGIPHEFWSCSFCGTIKTDSHAV